jgi:very-short-patch-repair endonuclease
MSEYLSIPSLNQVLDSGTSTIVPIRGELPYQFQVPTRKLLDIILALSPHAQKATDPQRKKLRQSLSRRFYNRTRPGFYMQVSSRLHIGYAGQPAGHGKQHQWRIFCDETLQPRIAALIKGTALVTVEPQPNEAPPTDCWNGNHSLEWGGLYLRSEAELRIAQALDAAGILFFANSRGRFGLRDAPVSNNQLSGRVEADFLLMQGGRCLVLEVDGQHHKRQDQAVRDYARDRVLLKAGGISTLRFTAEDCLKQPAAVVAEALAVLSTIR